MADYREYGLNSVPREERRLTGWDMIVIWGGISFCLPTFLIGALSVPGLSWGEALLVNAAGNFICAVLIGFAGYGGVRHGLAAVKLAERVMGPLFGRLVSSLAVFFSAAGWFGILLAMTVEGVAGVFGLGGLRTPLTIGLGVAMTMTAAAGHSRLLLCDKIAMPLLAVVMAAYAGVVLKDAPALWQVSYTPTAETSFAIVLNLIVGGYITGAFCAADFSRYAGSLRANWWGMVIGVFAVSMLLSILAMYAKLLSGEWNPITAVYSTGMGAAAVTIIVLSAWTTNHALAYSAGLALANLRGVVRPGVNTAIAGTAATVAAAAGLTDRLEPFLNQINLVFGPLLGVFLLRYFGVLRQKLSDKRVDSGKLGIAVLAGVAGELAWPEQLPALTGILASAGVYWLLAGRVAGRKHTDE